MNATIGFIGGGNMAASLIAGLLKNDFTKESVFVAEPDLDRSKSLHQQYGIQIAQSNQQLVQKVDTIVLAVKPQIMKSVLIEISEAVQQQKPLLISIAAGITIQLMSESIGPNSAIIRTMPNTPAMVSSGAAGLYANNHCSDNQRQLAERILSSVGIAVWVDTEEQLNAVTALSGSGPAYFFLVIEALCEAGIKLGLNSSVAKQLALQTAYGSAKMALESKLSPDMLRQQVTSPGGTTERALEVLNQGDLKQLFYHALSAAEQRAIELAKQ